MAGPHIWSASRCPPEKPAAFGSPDFFSIDGAYFPEGYSWHTENGTEPYLPDGDAEKAAALLKEAGYDGKPVRILTSRQYEFHYKMAQVAQADLEAAGFKVELDVVDWATLTQERTDPKLWDIYITHSPFLPEPSLMGIMSDTSPGWWATDAKHAAVEAFNAESDPAKRVALFADVQKVSYRMTVDLPSGPSLVEQVAYYSEQDGQITHLRLVCSGFRPG